MTMRRPVLIAAALKQERAALEAIATGLEAHVIPGIRTGDLLVGEIDGTAVALLRCGVGKVAAAAAVAAASALLPRCIISVGSAGALHAGHKVGDVVISTEVLQHDFAAVTASGFALFGYGSDWPSNGDPLLRSDPAIAALAESAARSIGSARGFAVSSGRITTGDWFVNDAATRDAIAARSKADLVEMEGAAIAYVAQQYGTPWIVIRSVSDAGDGNAAPSFDEYLELASNNAAAIVRAVLPLLL
ncbi:MAG: 5'-methylthioadenosine/S-adenosylhomocysteine nucleosidase [Chloroflexota bacterium]